jgi:hypothetical protein
MHYIFERRLNMLDIAIHELKDEEISQERIAEKLLKDHRLFIPKLEMKKEHIEIKKEKLTSDNAPKDFHIDEGKQYEYLKYTVPFSSSEFIDDIFSMSSKTEGLSIHSDKIIYKEYSHDKIEGNSVEENRIRHNARKAMSTVYNRLEEFDADAQEFNQTTLPLAIATRLSNEMGLRSAKAVH